jgi:hypothetical protein
MGVLYSEIRKVNDCLITLSRQKILNRRDLKGVTELTDAAALNAHIDGYLAAREVLFRDVVKLFLTVYSDPCLVLDGEPVLVAMYRLTGGNEYGVYYRWKCSPIMDALADFRIGFSENGDLILMEADSIARAAASLGFSSEVTPEWDVTMVMGQRLIRKKEA